MPRSLLLHCADRIGGGLLLSENGNVHTGADLCGNADRDLHQRTYGNIIVVEGTDIPDLNNDKPLATLVRVLIGLRVPAAARERPARSHPPRGWRRGSPSQTVRPSEHGREHSFEVNGIPAALSLSSA